MDKDNNNFVKLQDDSLVDVKKIKTILVRESYFKLMDPIGNHHVMKIYYNDCTRKIKNSLLFWLFPYQLDFFRNLCHIFNYKKYTYKADMGSNVDFKGIENDISLILKKAKEINHDIYIDDRIYKE